MVSELWLQHGIEWDMKGQLAEAGFLLPSINQMKSVHDKRILKNFSKYWDNWIVGRFSPKSRRYIRSPKLKATRWKPVGRKLRKDFYVFISRRWRIVEVGAVVAEGIS